MNGPDTAGSPPAPRRANDYLTRYKRFREPERLFDEFWREGELALFFGAAGTGKSILALQLADALARGGGLDGFRGPKGRRRVLYVDLRHTDEQFLMRCSTVAYGGGGRSRPHRFPRNLLRERPAPGADLCEWLRACVKANDIQAVIVDDLSAVRTTHDGTRETLPLMRRLAELRDELRISILVLAGSNEPRRGRPASEADLGRSRVLCSAADSVFAAGSRRRNEDDRYLIQTRARTTSIRWTWENAPTAVITYNATGLLAFEFDERFGTKMSEEKRRLICEITRLQEREYKTFREIARQLGISKSWACDLYKRWTPAMESGLEATAECGRRTAECETEDDEQEAGVTECEAEDNEWAYGAVDDERECGPVDNEREAEGRIGESASREEPEEHDPEHSALPAPKPAGYAEAGPETLPTPESALRTSESALRSPQRRSVYDLDRELDGYGNEIFVETRQHHDRRPTLWYKFDRKGHKRRFTRDGLGTKVDILDTGPYLEPEVVPDPADGDAPAAT